MYIVFNRNDPESTEQSIVNKIDSGEQLSEDELEKLVSSSFVVEEDKDSDLGDWTQAVSTIIKVKDRYFEIDWDEGLTEYQENYFDEQPYEVIPLTYQKIVTETSWQPIKKENN